MFEVQCPSCHASYKVDERRIPPTGLDMRCPKCGTSFQVSTPGPSEPPVLGGALGLGDGPKKPAHKATMLGVASQAGLPEPSASGGSGPPRPAGSPSPAGPPRPAPKAGGPPRPAAANKQTMMGVAPAQPAGPSRTKRDSDSLELASIEEEAEELEADELEADLPAAKAAGGEWTSDGIDLPTPSTHEPPGGIDLPAAVDSTSHDELDLPSPAAQVDEIGLPALGGETSGAGEVDLPSPADGEAGLPELTEAELPTLGAGLPDVPTADLPLASGAGLPELSEADLPSLDESELPIVGGSLPSPAGMARNPTGLPSLTAEVPGLDSPDDALPDGPPSMELGEPDDAPLDLSAPPRKPSSAGRATGGAGAPSIDPMQGLDSDDDSDPFGSGPTTTPESLAPMSGGGGYDEVDLGDGSDDDEFDAFPTETAPASSAGGASSDTYGDVALEGGGGELGLGADVERADAPVGPPPAASAQVELPGASIPPEEQVKRPKAGLGKAAKIGLAAAVVAAVGGGALGALSPSIGPYGAYLVIDMVTEGSNVESLRNDVKEARKLAGQDTSADLDRAFQIVERRRAETPRFKARVAYAAYLGFLYKIRFGSGSAAATQAQVLLADLAEAEPTLEHLELARIAGVLASGNREEALAKAKRQLRKSADHAALAGEAALGLGLVEDAQQAWQQVLEGGSTARGHYGLARTHLLAGDIEAARAGSDAALKENPAHIGAKLLTAEIDLLERKKDQELAKLLEVVIADTKQASQGERVRAMVLLGDLHMARSRIKMAQAVFAKALELESGNATAQRGLADAIFQAGQYGEAQTRYEAALQTDPSSLPAALGLARCKLRLEQIESALADLAGLATKHPDLSVVHYWTGQVKEAAGDKEGAQADYEKAIELDQQSPELVQSFVALTRLLGQAGKAEEAAVVIASAEKKFPEDPLVYEALADLSSSRGSFEDAINDYDRALELDPENIGLHFSRGVALRQARRFEEAFKELDFVEERSKDYPGLALERGNLYEVSGRSEEALRSYEAALAAAPDDLDLKLRVGCGRAQAGASKEALALLKQVHSSRSNSAEVNFCLGLAYLHMDGKLADSRRHLQRAVAYDASRANYHLYVGWVALAMSDYPLAKASLDKAIELDRTLADAYWKRGEMSVKQGAVADAQLDLNRALELSPSRIEAHAELAKAYVQLGQEGKALEEWRLATEGEGAGAYELYQYGRLLFDNQRKAEAQTELKRAVEKVVLLDPSPQYRWDVHRYYAMSLGRQREALDHWNAYAKNAPKSSPYREEAAKEMKAIMAMLGR